MATSSKKARYNHCLIGYRKGNRDKWRGSHSSPSRRRQQVRRRKTPSTDEESKSQLGQKLGEGYEAAFSLSLPAGADMKKIRHAYPSNARLWYKLESELVGTPLADPRAPHGNYSAGAPEEVRRQAPLLRNCSISDLSSFLRIIW